jgi:hypothetical protein
LAINQGRFEFHWNCSHQLVFVVISIFCTFGKTIAAPSAVKADLLKFNDFIGKNIEYFSQKMQFNKKNYRKIGKMTEAPSVNSIIFYFK